MSWADIIGLTTSAVTAIGVLVAARQLTLSKRQSKTQFEDGLAREYRELAHKYSSRNSAVESSSYEKTNEVRQAADR